MKLLRRIIPVFVILLIVVLAMGSITEMQHGADYAKSHIYGTWWFVTLWGAFGIVSAILTFSNDNWKHSWNIILLLSITCILTGGLLTMLTGQHGRMKLVPKNSTAYFFILENGEVSKEALPFSLVLEHFEVEYYPDSDKPKDFISTVRIDDGYGSRSQSVTISMNRILKHKGYRFYQSDYDNKGNSILSVSHDPWGISVTYIGYSLLVLALAMMLIKRRKTMKAVTYAWVSMLVILMAVLSIIMLSRPLMPVLRTPLFSVHISIILTAYALLLGNMVVGIIAVIKRDNLTNISIALLYPAVVLLATGIVIGAVWANISWGIYWSWDPKEVWALITLLVYILPLFPNVLPMFRKPLFFHVYGVVAILSVIVTYFGVKLFFGGIHAYN